MTSLMNSCNSRSGSVSSSFGCPQHSRPEPYQHNTLEKLFTKTSTPTIKECFCFGAWHQNVCHPYWAFLCLLSLLFLYSKYTPCMIMRIFIKIGSTFCLHGHTQRKMCCWPDLGSVLWQCHHNTILTPTLFIVMAWHKLFTFMVLCYYIPEPLVGWQCAVTCYHQN